MHPNVVGRYLGPGNVVIYESTVYPGATEEECVPILERASGLRYCHGDMPVKEAPVECASPPCQAAELDPIAIDDTSAGHFYCGYSPERNHPLSSRAQSRDLIPVARDSSTPGYALWLE